MYKYLRKVKIKSLKNTSNEVFYLTFGNELYNCEDKIDFKSLIGFNLIDNWILIYKENFHTDIYDIKTKIKKTNKPYLIYPKYISGIDNIWSIIRSENEKKWVSSDLNFNDLKEHELPEGLNKNFHYFFSEKKFISKNNKLIGCFNINETKYWVLQYDELINNQSVKLYGNLQIVKNKLFFFLFDSSRQTDTKFTFCIDIETGKILWKSNDIGGWLTTFQDKIYNLHMKTVKILNPNTFEIKTIDLTEQLSVLDKKQYDGANDYTWDIPFRFSINKYAINDDYLYFSQDKKNTVGIINLRTEQLVWYTDIEIDNKDNPIIMDIKVNNDRLYVQDAANTLHIFKKQENIA
jgi:outer membrane protein assembly factor BamB